MKFSRWVLPTVGCLADDAKTTATRRVARYRRGADTPPLAVGPSSPPSACRQRHVLLDGFAQLEVRGLDPVDAELV